MATPTPTHDPASTTPSAALRGKDEFYKETYKFFDTLAHHRKLMFAGAIALVGACILGGLLANRNAAKTEAGKDALFVADRAYETELKSLAGVKPDDLKRTPPPAADKKETDAEKKARESADKAKRDEMQAANKRLDDLAFQKIDVEAKFPETLKKYNEVISKFGGTRAGHEARMTLGSLYFDHGDPAKAAPLYQAAADAAPGNLEKAMALQALGYSLENSGKAAEALAAFEKSLNYGKDSGIQGDVMLSIARNQEAMQDKVKARSTYDQISAQLPNTEAARTADALKAKL